ncbi:MAG: peroxiredoxin [Methylococcales bacterium]|jgi:thioredoxin-dependent peroxiredoxin|nr:peroxiredoxin [Methylococcales bacterium]
MLENQQTAPLFTAVNQSNQTVNLADFLGQKNVVLYFYPKDDTPGCTIEANDFTKLASEFLAHDTVVIGVSKDSCESHQAFIDKFGLTLDLLADTTGELCEQYGVWREREKNGEKIMAILRSTFLINKAGKLENVMYGVTHDGHADDVLSQIQRLA